MPPEPVRMRIKVTGYVQGVAFRAYAERVARQHHLTGWVRNLSDGSVEIVAEGEKKNLLRLKDWAERGPSLARVSRISVSEEPATGEVSDFSIRY
ncbi:MAG: acylphosphatase [Candidatus Omnitrophica bacterium]|nr:acylphosphatase [Candidatus Omnitrophota bacterium]